MTKLTISSRAAWERLAVFWIWTPNNIASVNVLKGLSAATLYGEQGRNGVIQIITKNGQGGSVGEKMAGHPQPIVFS